MLRRLHVVLTAIDLLMHGGTTRAMFHTACLQDSEDTVTWATRWSGLQSTVKLAVLSFFCVLLSKLTGSRVVIRKL